MAGDGALINLGDLSKPATVLIEKISDAVGGIAKPWQIERVAKAEAHAEIIRAETKMQISELERRAVLRLIRDEAFKQENIESITAKAIPHLKEDAKPDKIEKDWLAHFFDRCKLISDAEMQSLWANILAKQANEPESFSKRTIELVASLDKSDAKAFSDLCAFSWVYVTGDGHASILIVPELGKGLCEKHEINFQKLNHLDTIGLIKFGELISYTMEKIETLRLEYFGCPIELELLGKKQFDLGKAWLTQVGQQLVPICGAKPSQEYFRYQISQWHNQNYSLFCPIDAKECWCKIAGYSVDL
ncbi:MAG: DUF2806 domain-containing protein [Ferrovibrio sp.]